MMNIRNSLALALVVLLAPACTVGQQHRFEANSIEEQFGDDGGELTSGSRAPLLSCPVSSASCGPDECVAMGMQRYAEPECRARGSLGEPCRMYLEGPENKTLHFPHGTMRCRDVYMQFCPCAAGLVCREATCQPEVEEEAQSTGAPGQPLNYYQARRPFPWAMGRFH